MKSVRLTVCSSERKEGKCGEGRGGEGGKGEGMEGVKGREAWERGGVDKLTAVLLR